MWSFSWKTLVVLSLLSCLAAAQVSARPTLRQITVQAGYIFSGTVTAVERVNPAQPDALATMRISFRVDEGVRGVRTRQSLVIREWAGLWNVGERYRVGERVVLALYAPSKLGLTSPVGGSLGRFALDRGGFLMTPEQHPALASDPAVQAWLKGKGRMSGRDFAHLLRRAAKE